MITRVAKIRFNSMKLSLTTCGFFHGSVKYYYFARCPSSSADDDETMRNGPTNY